MQNPQSAKSAIINNGGIMTRQEVLERVELDVNPFSHRPRLVVRTTTNITCRDLKDYEIEQWIDLLKEYKGVEK